MTIYFGISCKYHFQVCNFTIIRINNIWMTSTLDKSKQTNIESSIGTADENSPNLYLKAMAGWCKGKKIVDAISKYFNNVFPYFMFNPLSISSTLKSFTELYFFIQYLSLASMTNLHLVLIFSMGMATISLWSWPGNLKCAPTGFTVSLWHGWVTVPKCSLNLFLKGLSLQPMYCGPFTCAHWPDPLSQLTEYTTHGVRHDRLELIWNFSPVELQV